MHTVKPLASILFSVLLLVLLAGCSIHESRSSDENGQKKVAIETPIGGMKIDAGAQVETGIPIYPNARLKPKEGSNSHSANVNIDTDWFGMKLAVAEYVSDDTPDQVLGFYRDKLKTFGAVVECDESDYITIDPKVQDHGDTKDSSAPVSCDHDGHGNAVELKVGIKSRQHVVAIKHSGNGSEFALVYLQTHGRQGSL